MNREKLIEKYKSAAESYQLLADKEKKNLLLLSLLRLVTFFGGLILSWLGFTVNMVTGIVTLVLSASFFVFLLIRFSIHTIKKEFFTNLILINSNEADAVSGHTSQFYDGKEYINTEHEFSNDIDLFGKDSVFQYLNRSSTGYGSDILANWLSEPLPLTVQFETRQSAIREIAGKDRWRHEFMALGMNKNINKAQISGLIEWIEEESVISTSPVKKFLIQFLPVACICLLILTATGIVNYTLFLLVFLGNLLYVSSGFKKTGRIHERLSGKFNFLSSLRILLEIFGNENFDSSIFSEIKSNIAGRRMSAVESVNKLSRLIQAFDSRMNILVGFLLNGLLLWDYQCISRLEKWKNKYKSHFPVWLEMLGQVDAYISLGNYAYNNHDFIYPEISRDGTVFSARKLGHQLISEKLRVCNDFTLMREGIICVISGANMAGKSTFLRTISINYIMAMTGSPVCAEEMVFIPMGLFTSMRTTDSLATNESYFYAELKRLRSLKSRISTGEKLFFILDEILKGTNSDDKSLGSKLFVKRLIELGGTGLIATHDTSLGEMENEVSETIINRCFEVELEGGNIIFDYKLRDGITKKKNAVLLMKQMGIVD